MATTVTIKLNKPAREFAAGESTAFNIQGGVRYYDRETKSEQWTNYSAAIFAKAAAQIQFYRDALIEGAIVEVSGDKLKIRQFQGNNGLSLSIELLDAKLGAVFAPQGQQATQQRPAQQPQQPAYNQSPRPAQSAYNQAPQQGYAQPDFDQPPF
jgi:hypothetical protein